MLSTADIENIRQSLENERVDLLKRLEEHEAENEIDTMNPDRSDLAARYFREQRDTLLFARAEQKLKEIDLALKKIEEGTYGVCEVCGEPINPARLTTMPAVSKCVDCKSKTENR
jgi:DnaK suppressor protein